MTKIQRLALGGAAAVLLMVGALAGGIGSQAEAQTPQCWTTTTGIMLCRSVASTPTPEPTPAAIAPAGADEAQTSAVAECSIVTGCDIVVTDANGEPFKTMHITFTDTVAEVSEE